MSTTLPSAAAAPSKAFSRPLSVRWPRLVSSEAKAASTSSNKTQQFLGAFAKANASRSSVRPSSLNDRRQTSRSNAPANARKNDVFPPPGGPCSKYPRRYGTPRSAYHFFDLDHSATSLTNLSAWPSFRTTDSIGLLARAWPKGRHSVPQHV